jgi:hypothetical protein
MGFFMDLGCTPHPPQKNEKHPLSETMKSMKINGFPGKNPPGLTV